MTMKNRDKVCVDKFVRFDMTREGYLKAKLYLEGIGKLGGFMENKPPIKNYDLVDIYALIYYANGLMETKEKIDVFNCHECPYLDRGFLSEANECGYFKKAYEYFVPREGIPGWCPVKQSNIILKPTEEAGSSAGFMV